MLGIEERASSLSFFCNIRALSKIFLNNSVDNKKEKKQSIFETVRQVDENEKRKLEEKKAAADRRCLQVLYFLQQAVEPDFYMENI